MDKVIAPAPAACPHCGAAVAGGRFCSACGKELALHATTGAVLGDALGVRKVALAPYLRTAWLAVSAPAALSGRWMRGERVGLASPIAMMGAVTFVTAIVGFVLSSWTGTHAATGPDLDIKTLLGVAPFLQTQFPQAVSAAALDRSALNAQFQQVGGWFAAFGPSLLILPGWLALMPWRRIDQRGALIFALVESVFLMILTGLNTSLKLAAPTVAASGLVTTAFAVAVFAHGAVHVRGLTGSGWGYALTRPLLAALWILPIAYFWVVFVLLVTLALWT